MSERERLVNTTATGISKAVPLFDDDVFFEPHLQVGFSIETIYIMSIMILWDFGVVN